MACEVRAPDGATVSRGQVVMQLDGSARALLSAERTALNFLCKLSGVATATAALVQAVEGHSTGITCTRKTTRDCARWKRRRSGPAAAPITASASTTRC